jgi:hypothetical protein
MTIVSTIISSTFETEFGKWQLRKPVQHAMQITFRTSIDYDTEDGYRFLDILIYAPANYVGVLARHRWTVIPIDELEGDDGLKKGCEYRIGDSGWRLASYHDTCWTSDVGSILRLNERNINAIDTNYPNWYSRVEMTPELLITFEVLTSSRVAEDFYRDPTLGVLSFKNVSSAYR